MQERRIGKTNKRIEKAVESGIIRNIKRNYCGEENEKVFVVDETERSK